MFSTLAKEAKELSDSLRKINLTELVEKVTRRGDVQTWIKDTIKERQQTTGRDVFGNKMQTDRSSGGDVYSLLTMELKDKFGTGYGSIWDRVTLTDTGDFWNSLRVTIIKDGFRTEADFLKKDGHMQTNFTQDYSTEKEFEDAVLSLTEEQIDFLFTKYYIPELEKEINAILQN